MLSVKRTRREITRLVLTITMACMMAVLLASCETTSNGTTDGLQPRPNEHTHPESATREDVRNEIQTMVGPVVESLAQETSAAVGKNRRKYPIEPPSKNHPGSDVGAELTPPDLEVQEGTKYFEVQEGVPPKYPMRSVPFYCPALREPVLKVEKPGWEAEYQALILAEGREVTFNYPIKVTNITTNQFLVDLEIHEIMPPQFMYESVNFDGDLPDDPNPQRQTFQQEGQPLQTAVFSWKNRNRIFGPGESRTVTIRGRFPLVKTDSNFYTAADYMLGGCVGIRVEGVPIRGVRGDFHDMVDPVGFADYFRPDYDGAQVTVRLLAMLRNQYIQDLEVSYMSFNPLSQIVEDPRISEEERRKWKDVQVGMGDVLVSTVTLPPDSCHRLVESVHGYCLVQYCHPILLPSALTPLNQGRPGYTPEIGVDAWRQAA